MKRLMYLLSMVAVAAVLSVVVTSCGKDDPPQPPTVQINVQADPDDAYTAVIAVQATNFTSMAWDYGDGNTSTTLGAHSYTYEESGSYTISVVVTGEGGTASSSGSITIAASIEEMLAGVGNEGKTWVLTQADGAGKMGVGDVDNSLSLKLNTIPPLILAGFGLESQYSDEFTFYRDGKFTVDTKDGKGLVSALYGGVMLNLGVFQPGDMILHEKTGELPLFAAPMQSINNGTWSMSYDDFITNAVNEFGIPPAEQKLEQKVFDFTTGEKRFKLNLSTGAYIGFFDLTYPAAPPLLPSAVDNSFYIVKDVSPDELNIAIASCGLQEVLIYPTYMLHLTFVPK